MLDKEADHGEIEKILMLKSFTVFNVEQFDGQAIDAVFRSQSRILTRHRKLKRC
ncbi:hypothetical protein [Pantoea agglomerans]|uniref:hypothetical protein n=1 Tax=Enterobacter agglomerans TaxID=549 RepID=UPI0035B50A63